MADPLVLLHGFGGTHRAWDQVVEHLPPERYRPVVTPDLPGHGSRSAQRPISFEACVGAVLEDAPDEPFTLAGYSLGGRVAQLVALAAPERVARLVLISTSAGIKDPIARGARMVADDALAAELAAMSAESFADRWQSQPLFAKTPADASALWRADLMRNDPEHLAAALSGLSTGRMAPVWDEIAALSIPVSVIVGELDDKFVTLARRYGRDTVVIPGAGHGLPREAPAALAAAL